jgi:5-methylcytosine-specific restriction endonuclease McrA
MARRTPYTKLEKIGQVRPAHVQGMGDVLFKGIQCLAPGCTAFTFVRASEAEGDFRIACVPCGAELVSGGETKFFDYKLVQTEKQETIEDGPFVILHDDYVAEARSYKYCLLCYSLKPVELFATHSSRESGYQGECRLCKTLYNGIKNQSRLTDQHREAAQRRRLYRHLAGEAVRIDSRAVFEKFDGRCFSCERQLQYVDTGQRAFHLDHTLPASLLWPMTTSTATLLCSTCNNEKHDRWPSEYYVGAKADKLNGLALKTGYPYDLLAGPRQLSRESAQAIIDDTDAFLEMWIPYPEDIKKVRRLIRQHTEIDIFESATDVPAHLREPDEIVNE